MAQKYDDEIIRSPETENADTHDGQENSLSSLDMYLSHLAPEEDDTDENDEEKEKENDEEQQDLIDGETEEQKPPTPSDDEEELELQHTDQGFAMRLGHDGKQKRNELLDGKEEEEEEGPLQVEGFDEEAEKQKKAEDLEKEKERKRRDAESYKRRDAQIRERERLDREQKLWDDKAAEQEAKGLEQKKEEENRYNQMIRDRYAPDTSGITSGRPEHEKPNDGLVIEEESDPSYFSNISRTFRYTGNKSPEQRSAYGTGWEEAPLPGGRDVSSAKGLSDRPGTPSAREDRSYSGFSGYTARPGQERYTGEKRKITGLRRHTWQDPYPAGRTRETPAQAAENRLTGISFKEETKKQKQEETNAPGSGRRDFGQGAAFEVPVMFGRDSRKTSLWSEPDENNGEGLLPGQKTKGVYSAKKRSGQIKLPAGNGKGSQEPAQAQRARYTARKKNGQIMLPARAGSANAQAYNGKNPPAKAGWNEPSLKKNAVAAYGRTRNIYGKGIVISGIAMSGVIAADAHRSAAQQAVRAGKTSVPGINIKKGYQTKALQLGERKWELTTAEKRRQELEKRIRTESATEAYYKAKKLKSGMIRMEKDGSTEEEPAAGILMPGKKNRMRINPSYNGKPVSTGGLRGKDKVLVGAAATALKKKSGAGALASQSAAAKAATATVMRFQAGNGSQNQEQSQAESTGSEVIKDKVKKIIMMAAKKVVAGITATGLLAGAVAGTSTYNGFAGNGVNNYFYPIQANTETFKSSGVMMTQEVMAGMTDRMRAYGIPLTLTGSSSFGNGTVRIHIPGYDREYHGNVEDPWGDSQIMIDGAGNCLLIDGGAREILANKTIDYLKQQNVTHLTAIITHWHTDHYQAIEKMLETTDIKIDTLYCTPETESHNLSREPTGGGDNSSFNYIVNKVRESGGTVIFPPVNTVKQYTFGALHMEMWRLPGEEVEIANDTSLMVYFPELQYLTTGDMEESHNMDKYLNAVRGIVVKSYKLPHHGNGSPSAVGKLKSFGAELAWYNDTLPPGGWRDAAENAQEAGITVFNVLGGDIEVVCENKTMTYYCGNGKTYQVSIPYVGSGTSANTTTSGLMKQVCDYAKSWVGKIPYKTTGDPNEERFLPLKEGRGSDCSWFVYHVLEHFSLVGDEFIHSYEWGNSPDKYPNFTNVGTDISTAQPGDIICTGAGNSRHDSHVGIYVGDGKWVECAGSAGGTVLSDVDKNPRQICRYKGSGNIMPTASGGAMSPANQTTYGFTTMTEAIVEAHINDFNYYTFDSFMASYGGANEQGVTNYLRSLGGVFAKHAGRGEEKITSAGEFQEIAEFIMGIYTMWGPDYHGAGYAYFIDKDDPRRFYTGMGETGHWFPDYGPVERTFSDKEQIITDCGSGATQMVKRTCLYPGSYAGMSDEGSAQNWIRRAAEEYGVTGGTIVHDKNQLQVGDLIQMGDHSKGWRHVCVVGEVWGDGTVITYETGHRFVGDGNYKSEFNPNPSGEFPDGDYAGYQWWFGVRLRPIAQTGGLSGMGTSGMATQNLGDIKINSVKVDGQEINKKDVEMSNLASYTRNGVETRGVKVNYKFVDKDGRVIGESGASGTFGGTGGGLALTGSAARIIEVAESHMGGPYVYGGNSWENGIDCSHFVTRVLQEAGVYDGPYMTSYDWADYGREVPDIEHAQAGDIVISHNEGHVSIYDGVKWVYEAKGSQWGCVHDRLPGNIDTIRRILPDGAGTAGGAAMQMTAAGGISGGSPVDRTPSGQGQTIEIPDGLGDKYKFMDWAMITSTSSNQYRLREQAGENYDEEGFGIINGRYVIACAMTYGAVGDYVDFYNTNGLIFHCIIGEAKKSTDAGYSKWGHDDGHNIIEFCVQRSKWYGTGHDNPGTASCHPEWKGTINKAVNLGSYFDDPSGMRLTGGGGTLTPGGNQLDYAAMYLMKQVLSMSALGSYYSEPNKMEKYGKYCYDLIDYAVCESHGADVDYETTGSGDDEHMDCTATVTIECDLKKLEAHDKHFKSWELIFPDGDMMPSNYMEMAKELFELIFNVDTSVNQRQAMMASNPFDGNEQIVYELLKQKGYNAAQIAGIMANIEGESHFRPDATNDDGAGGLIQWMDGRLDALKNLAASKNVDWTDIGVQIDYLDQEIKSGSGWSSASQKEKFENTDDPYDAGYLFSKYFERHGIASENARRGKRAEEYYDKILVSGSSIQYVQWAIDIANDDSHGYDQGARNGPDYDCSSLVFYALKNSGFDVGSTAFTTSTMRKIMEGVGFENVHINSVQDLLPGDVVWWDGAGNDGHTEIYIGDGKFVGAHSNHDGRQGDSGGGEINVQTDWDADWYQALRLSR